MEASLDTVVEEVSADVESVGVDRKKTLDLMQSSLNFLAGVIIPEVMTYLFPQIHCEIWQLLREYVDKPNTFFKIALGLPRGMAKTTLIKLFVVYCVLFTEKKFILIIGSTATRAENSLADIYDMLNSPNVKRLFGNWVEEKDTEPIKKFSFAGRRIVLAAIGAGGSLRGLNLNNERPDVIICDDIQSAEDKDSEQVADKLLEWMLGTLFKAKSPKGCLYVYIGNMFAGKNCILAKLKKSKEWVSFVVGAILSDWTSIWPELQSAESLLAELEHDVSMGKPAIWFAEVQNDPEAGVSSNFDVNKVPMCPFDKTSLLTGGAIIIDLSGQKKGSDAAAIGYFAFIEGRNVYKDIETGVWSPLETIEVAIKMGFKWNCPFIFVESVAYQASFLYWFNYICTTREIEGFQLFEVYPGANKVSRILGFMAQLLNGDVLLDNEVRAKILFQASNYRPTKKDNTDDLLDLGAYLNNVLSLYSHMLENAVSERLLELLNPAPVIQDCSSF